ncbi:MAG: helix-turn-helix domain-containing protein [Thiolinea sp.]
MMNEKELIERDQKRDLGAELLESVRQMTAGQRAAEHQVQVSAVSEARHKIGLSQAQFAELMGVSKRTLQEWEQGRKKPSGAANSLLRIAMQRPDVLREVFGDAA